MKLSIVIALFACLTCVSASRKTWKSDTELSFLKGAHASLSVLQQMAMDCTCEFSGTCECGEAKGFMQCITAACASGACKCEPTDADHFKGACGVMSAACPAIGLQCPSNGDATCLGKPLMVVPAGNTTASAVPADYVTFDRHKEAVAERRTHGHHLIAILLLTLFLIVTLLFVFVSGSNQLLAVNTWAVIDSIAVTTIAVTMFYVINAIFVHFTADYPEWTVALHIGYAVFVLFIAIFGAYELRNDKVGQAAFNAVIYWICLLAKGGALASAQTELSVSYEHVIMITLGALLFFVALIAITHKLKPEASFYDDVETALAGGAFAAGVCQLASMFIHGLDHSAEQHKSESHEALYTGLFALFTCVVAVGTAGPMYRLIAASEIEIKRHPYGGAQYWKHRFLAFVNGFIGIMPYFTVSLGAGTAVCTYFDIHPATMGSKIAHMVTNVVLGFSMIVICAYVPYFKRETPETQALAGLILGFGGFIAGYAMSMLLANTFDFILEGAPYTAAQLVLVKVCMILFFNAILIPVYYKYLKPTVMRKDGTLKTPRQ